MASTNDIVQKLWNLCHVLRDDGVTYHQYVTELTYLLFLKMAKETGIETQLPAGYCWDDLTAKEGVELLEFYKKSLIDLGAKGSGRVQAIYANASTTIRQPRHVRMLVDAIDGLDWYSAKHEGLGDLYEGLLEKNAAGWRLVGRVSNDEAGQYGAEPSTSPTSSPWRFGKPPRVSTTRRPLTTHRSRLRRTGLGDRITAITKAVRRHVSARSRDHRGGVRRIEAAFETGLSNARVEGTNTRLRLLTRVAFGFHSAEPLLTLAMLKLGGMCPALPHKRYPLLCQ